MIGLQESSQLGTTNQATCRRRRQTLSLVPASHDVGQAVVPTLSQTELAVPTAEAKYSDAG